MALAQETDILLLDEPTTFLDVTHQVEVLDLLTDLNRDRGTTIVMVLHDMNLAARYADHLFALRDGRLVASGPPARGHDRRRSSATCSTSTRSWSPTPSPARRSSSPAADTTSLRRRGPLPRPHRDRSLRCPRPLAPSASSARG